MPSARYVEGWRLIIYNVEPLGRGVASLSRNLNTTALSKQFNHETLRDDVDFGGLGTTRWRLGVFDAGELPFHPLQQRPFGAALKDFGNKGAARDQHIAGKFKCCLDQCNDPKMIG
jgi:hypothetical protein